MKQILRFGLAITILTAAATPRWATAQSHGADAHERAVQEMLDQGHWPGFRGPTARGVAADNPNLPEKWSRSEGVKWSTGIPGIGWSGPAIWGRKVFVTAVHSDEENEKPKKGLYLGQGRAEPPKGIHHWMLYGLDLDTGEIVWSREAEASRPVIGRHPKNSYASETPVTDGERVYALFGDVGIFCYDLDGKPVWKKRIEPRETLYNYGAAASPVLHGDLLIVIYDNQEDSFIVAYNKRTGEQAWRTERDEISTWATPFVWTNPLRTEIVAPGRTRIRSYDLEGSLLWEMDGKMSRLVIPSPFASFGMIYITSGYVGDDHRPVYAIKPGASGDISLREGETSNDFVVWYQSKVGPYNPSPIIYGDYYYTLLDRGFITCHDARTGDEIYGRQRIESGATFTASPVAYNGKLFCLSEDGNTYVIKAGPEYELLGKNVLDELSLASPAVGRDELLIRTASNLYCIVR